MDMAPSAMAREGTAYGQGARTVGGNLRTLAGPRPAARVYARGVHSPVAGRHRAGPVLSRESTDAGAGYSGVYPSDPGSHRGSLYSGPDTRPAVVVYETAWK